MGKHTAVELPFLRNLKQRNVVRVGLLYVAVCWLILEPVHVIFHMLEVPVWANRLVLILMALGLPAVVIFAWVYEITPEGLKPSDQVPHGQSIRKQTSRRLDFAIIAVLAIALAYFVFDKLYLSRHITQSTHEHDNAAAATDGIRQKSIAVIPFVDLSDQQDQAFFAAGLAEEIQALLATLPELQVTGRSSSLRIDTKASDPRTVGTQLGVAYIAEGSVRRSGDRMRITAQLVSTDDGMQRWAETYERNPQDLMNLQQEIAAAIGRALEVEIRSALWQQSWTPASPEAYIEYLRGQHAFDRYDKAGLQEAVTHFERALELQPGMLRAREGLATTRFLYYAVGFVPTVEGATRAREETETLLREHPESATGHGLRARLLTTFDWNWAAAQHEVDAALGLQRRGYIPLFAAADLNNVLGKWEESERYFREALALDPLDADTLNEFQYMLYRAGRLTEAESASRRLIQIRPTFPDEHAYLAMVLAAEGKNDEALKELQQEVDIGLRLTCEARIHAALGHQSDSVSALSRAEQEFGDTHAFDIASVYAFRGEADEAFKWLDRAYTQRDYYIQYLRFDPIMLTLRQDARYKALLRKMNLPD